MRTSPATRDPRVDLSAPGLAMQQMRRRALSLHRRRATTEANLTARMAGGRFRTAPILPAVKRRLMGVATQQPGVVTARDREFTTLRGAPKSSLLAPLSLSCSGIQISANIDEESLIINVVRHATHLAWRLRFHRSPIGSVWQRWQTLRCDKPL
jgi:hypothetical protein